MKIISDGEWHANVKLKMAVASKVPSHLLVRLCEHETFRKGREPVTKTDIDAKIAVAAAYVLNKCTQNWLTSGAIERHGSPAPGKKWSIRLLRTMRRSK